jgi:hypothetical protein
MMPDKQMLPKLTPRMRAKLRQATWAAHSKFSLGGRVKDGKRAPKPITLRSFDAPDRGR